MANFAIGIALVAAGLLLQYIFQPPGPNVVGPRLADLTVSGSQYGEPWPLAYGTYRFAGNMIYAADITEVEVTKEVGGKGGGGGTQTTYEYFGDFAFGFCEGPVEAVVKVLGDGKLLLDRTGTGKVTDIYEGVEVAAINEIQTQLVGDSTQETVDTESLVASVIAKDPTKQLGLPARFYLGDEQQLPDPLIEHFEGVGEVSGHRGLAYMVAEKMPLKNFGNRFPNIHAVITTNNTDTITPLALTKTGSMSTGKFVVDPDRRTIATTSLSTGALVNYDTMVQTVQNNAALTNVVAGSNIAWSPKTGDFYTMGDGTFTDEDLIKRDGASLSEIVRRSNAVTNPTVDIEAFTVTLDPLLKETVEFVTVIPNRGSIKAFRSTDLARFPDSQVLTWSDSDGNNIYGNDLSQADGVGGMQCVDRVNEILYVTQNWTNGRGVKLFKFKFLPIQLPANLAFVTQVDLLATLADADGKVASMFHVAGDNSLILHRTGGKTQKFDLNTNTITVERTGLPSPGRTMKYSIVRGGIYAFAYATGVPGGGNIFEVNTNTLETIRTTALNTFETDNDAISLNYFDEETYSILTDKYTLRRYFLNRAEPGGVPLSSIVFDLCIRAGLTSDQIDVSELTGITVKGFAANAQSTARRHIESLMQAYFFDGVEVDGKIVFKLRGQGVDRALSLDDLGELSSENNDPSPTNGQVVETRTQHQDLPRRVTVKYADADREYQLGAQHISRITSPGPTVFSESEENIEMPLVLSATEAKQVAEKWMAALWTGRSTFKTVTHWGHIDLDPTDVVTLPLASGTRTARITNIDVGANMHVEMELQEEDDLAFDAISSADDGFGFTQQAIPASVLTKAFFLDTPMLSDVDEVGGTLSRAYFAMAGYSTPWPGGVLMRSDDDVSFKQVGASFTPVSWGVANTTPLPAPPNNDWTVWDDTSTVTFWPQQGGDDFVSKTDAEVLNGENAVLVGSEIVQFGVATLNSDNSITLSHLLRGRKGTDQHIGTHAASEQVILLTVASIATQNMKLSLLDQSLLYRPVTVSHVLDTAKNERFTYTGVDLKPYSPVLLKGSRSGTNLTISWRRRQRVNRKGLIGTTLLAEASEQYELELVQNGELLDTLVVDDATQVVYTVAQLTAACGLIEGEMNVLNKGFEDGDFTGWSATGGVGAWSVQSSIGLISAAHSGTYFASSQENLVNTHVLSQEMHLLDDLHFTVDELRFKPSFSAECWTAKAQVSSDTHEFQVRWLTEAGGVIQTDTTGPINQTGDGAWVQRSLSGNVPPNARKVQIRGIVQEGGSGTNARNAFDDFQLIIGSGVPKLEATAYQMSEVVGRGFGRTEKV